jgi:transposase
MALLKLTLELVRGITLKKVTSRVHVDIVKRFGTAKKIVVPPKRWTVERTFACLRRCRRLARYWENFNQKAPSARGSTRFGVY